MSAPPPPPPRSHVGGKPPPKSVAIENVELLLEADQQRQSQHGRKSQPSGSNTQQRLYYPQHPPPGGGYLYSNTTTGAAPMYGLPSHAYYGSTGAPSHGGLYPPPPSVGHAYPPGTGPVPQHHHTRRTRSTPEAATVGSGYPSSEYQPLLMGPPPPALASYSGGDRASLAAVAAQAMRMESSGANVAGMAVVPPSAGALTLDDIERSFDQVMRQQYSSQQPPPPQHHHQQHHHRSTSEVLPGSSSNVASTRRSASHRRAGSWGNPLPPPSPLSRSPAGSTTRKRADSADRRSRTFSGTAFPRATASLGHRRSLSRASSTDVSVASVASLMSVVSDISKSAFFGGVTEAGQVQMHYPTENVRLIMQGSLPRGNVYCHPIDSAVYERYHVVAEEVQLLQWENMEDDMDAAPVVAGFVDGVARSRSSSQGGHPYKGLQCHCRCNNCAGCTGKTKLLPTHHYVINVPDDIYRRLLDEVVASEEMPCGLYFCGHHEDVSTPSIFIALGLVLTLFSLMGVAAMATTG